MSAAPPLETDVALIGAGPVALFQAFELGLLECGVQIIDALPHIGGQCAELYADKPIYDIPGLARCTGRELVRRLEQQLAPFKPGLHLGQLVTALQPRDDGRFDLATDRGVAFIAKAVVIAAGVGAFQPRRLALAGLDAWHDTQSFEHDPPAEACEGRHVVVCGGGAPAAASALGARAADAASVTLLHRRDALDDEAGDTPMLDAFNAKRSEGAIAYVAGVPTGVIARDGRLVGLRVAARDGRDLELACDLLVTRLGWAPRLGPIAQFGLALEKKQLVVDTERFETSMPGIHAVGDIVAYPGKRKLIVCGFHEATLAAYAIAARIKPERAEPTLYTTTSPLLHRLLGV